MTPATRIGECRLGAEPSRLLRCLVTSPQISITSEATPARPARVISTLSTTDAGPRRSWATPAPLSAEPPTTARRTRNPTRAIPTASLVDRPVESCVGTPLPAPGDDCTVNTLRAVLAVASLPGRRAGPYSLSGTGVIGIIGRKMAPDGAVSVWFGPEESPLYGALHLPDGPARGAVVLCPPLG